MATPSPYRLTGSRLLLQTMDNWDRLMNFRVQLIACGGTAPTLLKLKESTKDIDFIVPVVNQYERLIKFLKAIGYTEKGEVGHTRTTLYSCTSFGPEAECSLQTY